MQRCWPIMTLFIATTLALSACSLAQMTPAANDWLSSAVPATLTALASQPTAVASPTGTPLPSPTPLPPTLQVVYEKDGGIWIWREEGQPKQLSHGPDDERPRISDDGKIVVFKRNNELYRVNADGTDLRNLMNNASWKSYLPLKTVSMWPEFYDFLPNTHILYFSTEAEATEYDQYSFYYTYDLFRVDVDSGEVRQLFWMNQGGIPYFSPDGSTIALAQPQVIYLIDSDGSNYRKGISYDVIHTFSILNYIPYIIPLPDSNGYRVVIPPPDWKDDLSETSVLWNIPIKGEASQVFSFPEVYVPSAALSSDGKMVISLVYSKYPGKYDNQACIFTHEGEPDKCYPPDGHLESVEWLSDGSKFTYGFSEGGDKHQCYMEDSFTGNRVSLKYCVGALIDNKRGVMYDYDDEYGYINLISLDETKIRIDRAVNLADLPPDMSFDYGNNWFFSGGHWELPYDFSH